MQDRPSRWRSTTEPNKLNNVLGQIVSNVTGVHAGVDSPDFRPSLKRLEKRRPQYDPKLAIKIMPQDTGRQKWQTRLFRSASIGMLQRDERA
jgi:hypothetical protein